MSEEQPPIDKEQRDEQLGNLDLPLDERMKIAKKDLKEKLKKAGKKSSVDNSLGLSPEQVHESAKGNLSQEERGNYNVDLTAPPDD